MIENFAHWRLLKKANVKVLLPGMEKEKYEPSYQEVKKAENIMEVEGLEERSQEVQDALNAGKARGHSEVLEILKDKVRSINPDLHNKKLREGMQEDKIELQRISEAVGLSKRAEDLLITRAIQYYPDNGRLYPNEDKGVIEKDVIELIEKLPKIEEYDVCGAKIINGEIVKKLLRRFPKACVSDWDYEIVPSKKSVLVELADELGINDKNPQDYKSVLDGNWNVLSKYLSE